MAGRLLTLRISQEAPNPDDTNAFVCGPQGYLLSNTPLLCSENEDGVSLDYVALVYFDVLLARTLCASLLASGTGRLRTAWNQDRR
jgi:hypothetical protein